MLMSAGLRAVREPPLHTPCWSCGRLAHVDLAGHGRRDQGRAVLPQALDGGFNLGDHLVDLRGLAAQEVGDCPLFTDFRESDHDVGNRSLVENGQRCAWRYSSQRRLESA